MAVVMTVAQTSTRRALHNRQLLAVFSDGRSSSGNHNFNAVATYAPQAFVCGRSLRNWDGEEQG